MLLRLMALLALTCLSRVLAAQPVQLEDNILFDDSNLFTIYIEIEEDSLEQIMTNVYSYKEYPARFILDRGWTQDVVENVGFRLRGNTSRVSWKKSFKVSFNTFEQGRKYRGLEKLNLNGEHNDPSIIRAKLGWDLFQAVGVPASRASHVKLFINGDYYGLYINVEHVDEQFLMSRFGNDDGNLYKCLYPADLTYLGPDPAAYRSGRAYELKLKENDDEGYADLAHFVDVLNNTPDPVFPEAIEAIFNVNGFLRILAVDVALGSWDDYWYLKNNFYLYHNPETGRFEFIPYDYDNTFGIDWFGIDWGTRDVYAWGHPFEDRPLVRRILAVREYRNRFSFYLRSILEKQFNPDVLFPLIDEIFNIIGGAARTDIYRTMDYGYTFDDFVNSYTEALGDHVQYGLKPYVTTRYNAALDQLDHFTVRPIVSEMRYRPLRPQTTDPIRFTARIEDEDPAALTIAVQYQTLEGISDSLPLHDDGQHDDGVANDGYYGGELPALELHTTMTYSFVATEPSGRQTTSEPATLQVGYDVPPLFINEFMASNSTTVADESGAFDDWVELYNAGGEPVGLSGLYLTDNLSRPDKWALPDITIPAGDFIVIWADDNPLEGSLHAPFKLERDGEQLGLYTSDSAPIDTLTFGVQENDVAFGRIPDGGDLLVPLTVATPGSPNSSSVATEEDLVPDHFGLDMIYPNPFNANTTVSFSLARPEFISIDVYDTLGRHIHRLAGERYTAGVHSLVWDGTDDTGQKLASGLYLVRLSAYSDVARATTIPIVLVR